MRRAAWSWLRRKPRSANLLVLGTAQGHQTFTNARMSPELRAQMRRSFRQASRAKASR